MNIRRIDNYCRVSERLDTFKDVEGLAVGLGLPMFYVFVGVVKHEEQLKTYYANVRRHEELRSALQVELSVPISAWLYGQLNWYAFEEGFAAFNSSTLGDVDVPLYIQNVFSNIDKKLLNPYINVTRHVSENSQTTGTTEYFQYRRATRKLRLVK